MAYNRGFSLGKVLRCILTLHLSVGNIQTSLGFQPPDLTIESSCGKTFQLEKSYLPAIKDWSALPVNGSVCNIGFQSQSACHEDKETHVQVSILNLDLPGTQKPCDNGSRVDVVDADGKSIISDPHGMCGDVNEMTFTCTTNRLYLRVTSTNTSLGGSLKVLATAYNLEVCDTATEFGCDNHRCIDKSLTCNGYNDCGDNSDETDGCWMSTEVIVVVAVGGTLGVLVVILISFYAFKRRVKWGVGTGLAASGRFAINNAETEKESIKRDRKRNSKKYETLTAYN